MDTFYGLLVGGIIGFVGGIDVDVKVNRIFECSDLSINDTFEEPELPYYNKKKKSVIVYREFYDYR